MRGRASSNSRQGSASERGRCAAIGAKVRKMARSARSARLEKAGPGPCKIALEKRGDRVFNPLGVVKVGDLQ
jgi:hypothetical protein